MLKPKTHFEQVPLEIVKKIAEVEIPPEITMERAPIGRKQKSQKDRLATKRQEVTRYRRASEIEASKS
jgi:hypothetical protein